MKKTKIQSMIDLEVDFWNDSCDLKELSEAVEQGATGATSNPVIVYDVVKNNEKRWVPVLEKIIANNQFDTEDEIAWKLIEHIGIEASKILYPIYEKTNKKKGFLSMQINPKYYRNKEKMIEHAKSLALISPNIAIKAPATDIGIRAMEEMTALGINVNSTVSFSVSQAIAAAEAIERGLKKAVKKNIDGDYMHPYVTLMVGRVEDHMQKAADKEGIAISSDCLSWAGIAVFKKAYRIFKEQGYSSTLLAAAYRNHLQWTELIGDNVIQTIPYKWWKKFNMNETTLEKSIDRKVDETIIDELQKLNEFKKAYNLNCMSSEEFEGYGASVHTLKQFLNGYQDLVGFVREKMLK